MQIGIPRETYPEEYRVAVTPEVVTHLIQLGFTVKLETNAGHAASFSDKAYTESGATIATSPNEVWESSDILLKVRAPSEHPDLGGRDRNRQGLHRHDQRGPRGPRGEEQPLVERRLPAGPRAGAQRRGPMDHRALRRHGVMPAPPGTDRFEADREFSRWEQQQRQKAKRDVQRKLYQ